MMMNDLITGGSVSYEDGVKAREDYAPAKKAKVELNFTVPEGANAGEALKRISDQVVYGVNVLLGKIPVVNIGAITNFTPLGKIPNADVTGPQPDMAAWEEPLPKDAPVQDKLDGADTPRARRSRRTSAPVAQETTPPVSTGPVVITDADLTKAASLAAGKHGPEIVKTVMSQYTTGPSIGSISPDKRQVFLDALDTLGV